jgi:hypothetical protein
LPKIPASFGTEKDLVICVWHYVVILPVEFQQEARVRSEYKSEIDRSDQKLQPERQSDHQQFNVGKTQVYETVKREVPVETGGLV